MDSCCCLQVFLVFGKSGWIGGLIGGMLKERGLKFEYANARLEDRAGILADIEHVKPTHILNAAGLTGRPNVDWCEDHKVSIGLQQEVALSCTCRNECKGLASAKPPGASCSRAAALPMAE